MVYQVVFRNSAAQTLEFERGHLVGQLSNRNREQKTSVIKMVGTKVVLIEVFYQPFKFGTTFL